MNETAVERIKKDCRGSGEMKLCANGKRKGAKGLVICYE